MAGRARLHQLLIGFAVPWILLSCNAESAEPTRSASIESATDMSIWSDEPMAKGRSRFLFSNWAGPDLPVWAYVPVGLDQETVPVLILLHGARRDPRLYLEEWTNFADQDGFILVAPEFTDDDFSGSSGYNTGNMWTSGADKPNPPEEWSFAAIEPLFDDVITKLGGQQQRYTLYGHSAGSQFVHRFMLILLDARVDKWLFANAGWYTMPDPMIDFPYGLNGLGVTDDMVKRALANDVVILLGDKDNDPKHGSLNRSEAAMKQGPHRFARGKSFYAAGKNLADQMNTEFNWSYRIIPGVAHSNGGIARGAHDLIE